MTDHMETNNHTTRPAGKKMVVILTAAVVIVAAAAILFASGIFLSKPNRVLRAAYKSCKENGLAEIFSDHTAEYTTDLELSVEETKLSVEIASTEKKKELTFSVGSHGISTGGTALLDDKNLKVKIPILGDTVFVYDYRQENNGYFVQLLEENGINADEWNRALAEAVSDQDMTMDRKEGSRLLLSAFRGLSFETAEKKTVRVNGKDRSCKGYRAAVTPEDIKVILEAAEQIQGEGYRIWLDRILKVMGSDYETFLRELMRQEIYMTFYLDRNRLAEVSVENTEHTIMNLYFAKKEMLSVDINAFSLEDKTCTGSVKLTRGADIEELGGERFDIGNASKEELLKVAYTSLFRLN